MGGDQFAYDGEADARPGDRAGVLAAPEAVEDVRELVGRYAGSGVGDVEASRRGVAAGADDLLRTLDPLPAMAAGLACATLAATKSSS